MTEGGRRDRRESDEDRVWVHSVSKWPRFLAWSSHLSSMPLVYAFTSRLRFH